MCLSFAQGSQDQDFLSKSIKNGLFIKILKIKIPNVCDFLAAKYTVATSVFECAVPLIQAHVHMCIRGFVILFTPVKTARFSQYCTSNLMLNWY